ncbi:hypothetical protein Tco_1210429 [Tanacetum coccineum]
MDKVTLDFCVNHHWALLSVAAWLDHENCRILFFARDCCSEDQYAVSIKEDTAYLCLHSPKTAKETRSNTPYPGKIILIRSRITSITVNEKNTYELKGKFLDDLHKNAFSETHGEDTVKHIKYFLKIVDPIDLPYVNQDKLRVVVFPISLAGDAWRWFDGIKESITSWKLGSDEIEPTNEETFDLEETNHCDEEEISEIFRIETNLFDYETPLCEKFKEFDYLLKIDHDLLTKDINGFKTYEEYKDDWIYEWNENIPWPYKHNSTSLKRIKKVNEKSLCCTSSDGNNEGDKATALEILSMNNVYLFIPERMAQSMEDTLSKFMSELAKRHEENSNLIKEI